MPTIDGPVVDPTCDIVWVTPWSDEVIDTLGHDPRSPYVERFWLGILGPSATWLARAIAYGFESEPDGFALRTCRTLRASSGSANAPVAPHRSCGRSLVCARSNWRTRVAMRSWCAAASRGLIAARSRGCPTRSKASTANGRRTSSTRARWTPCTAVHNRSH